MQNGQTNGATTHVAPQPVQINPTQAAAFALQFLPRAPHTQAEREAFDLAAMFLQAIVTGQAIVSPAPPPQVQATPAAEPPPA